MRTAPWRVVLITVLPGVARGYAQIISALGHEPVAVIVPRRRAPGAPPTPFAAEHVADDPHELDVLFAASKHSLAPLLRGCEPDLAICTGFPWLIPAEAIEVPKHGIVNGHPSLLPRYRGPFPADPARDGAAPRAGWHKDPVAAHELDRGAGGGTHRVRRRAGVDRRKRRGLVPPVHGSFR
jgi:folate-dependent phosphoribosylglycinamide formyltransferase PurN